MRRKTEKRIAHIEELKLVFLIIGGLVLAGLLATFYVSEIQHAVQMNQTIQELQTQQGVLERTQQDLRATIAQEQSPAYIQSHAQAQGMIPATSNDIKVQQVQGLTPIPSTP